MQAGHYTIFWGTKVIPNMNIWRELLLEYRPYLWLNSRKPTHFQEYEFLILQHFHYANNTQYSINNNHTFFLWHEPYSLRIKPLVRIWGRWLRYRVWCEVRWARTLYINTCRLYARTWTVYLNIGLFMNFNILNRLDCWFLEMILNQNV